MTARRRLLWAVPLLVIGLLVAALLALPRFVASNAHRATIEALATSLTGRQVNISGNLSLALLPEPQFIAENISIGGPANEVITARSLTLDIALPALLRGQLAARSLTLRSPRIVLPWPLPGGTATIIPPPWLAALHAQITDGTLSLGKFETTDVDADIFTSRDGALAVSGTAFVQGSPFTLSLGLAAPDFAGRAALAIDSRVPDGTLGGHFSGTLNGDNTIAGNLTGKLRLPGDTDFVAGNVSIVADAARLKASDIHLTRDTATLDGSAMVDLNTPAFSLDLHGDNLSAASFTPLFTPGRMMIPGRLAVSVRNLRLPRGALPEADIQATFGAEGIALDRLSGTLPGGGVVTIDGKINASGELTARAALQADDLSSLAAAFGDAAGAPPQWRQLKAQAILGGTRDDLSVTGLQANLGDSRGTGSVVIRRTSAGVSAQGALHFDRIDLAAVVAALRQLHLASGLAVAGEISADYANYRHLQFGRLLLDATFAKQLVIHRLSATVYGGTVIANLAITPDGTLIAAQARLALPSATPLAALLPAAEMPAVPFHAPLTVTAAAAGAPDALHLSAVGTLGEVEITASPVIDIPAQSVSGPLTLRHPDAIAALGSFGLDTGLAWPGAGSISLRANMLIAPTQFGLPDFVLSFGDLTAAGKVLVTTTQVSADVAADTLALPALPPLFAFPWTNISRQIDAKLTASQVWLGSRPLLGASAAVLTMAPGHLNLAVSRAALGGGSVSGALGASFNPSASATAGDEAGNAAPVLTLGIDVTNVEAASLGLPIIFPYTIPGGALTGGASLSASGYTPATWAATLSGSADFNATNGQFTGFNLAALRQALQSPKPAEWQKAASSGTSDFSELAVGGTFDHGIFSLKTAKLQGPDGNVAGAGSIDIPDRAIAVRVTLLPSGSQTDGVKVTSVGGWDAPKQVLPRSP